tara:strand:+ start:2999 stop:3628 length:630 start_codon:yes stop_codon:yes gene_type:complete
MKVLELFKGSGSITNYYKDNNDVEVISLDFVEKYKPTICSDIMTFDYKQFDIGYFDIIWASPECKIFSSLQNTWIGRKWKDKEELIIEQQKNAIFINRTIEIIDYLRPKYYFIENPKNSQIWKFVDNKKYIEDFIIVDYCAFGYIYKKPTKILTNKKLDNVLCKCINKHTFRLGITGKKEIEKSKILQDKTTLLERYSIPEKLLEYLLN